MEGITDLLWVLLMTIPVGLGWRPEVFAAGLGLTCGIGAVGLAAHLAGRFSTHRWVPVGVAAIALLTPEYWRMCSNGLEGGLYALLVMGTLHAVLIAGPDWVAGVLGGLVFATRPEGAVILPLAVLAWTIQHPPRSWSRLTWRNLGLTLGCWTVIGLGITVWRMGYYGDWMPNSVRAKQAPLNSAILKAGLWYLVDTLRHNPLLIVASLVGIFVRPRSVVSIMSLGVGGFASLIALKNGGDWMEDHRLILMYAPVAAAATGPLFDRLAGFPKPYPAWAGAALVGLALALCQLLPQANEFSTRPYLLKFSPHEQACRSLGQALAPVLTASDIVAPEAIGLLCWELPAVTMHEWHGLTDRYIARNGRHRTVFGRTDRAYTANVIRPNLYVSRNLKGQFPGFSAVYQGDFDRDYVTYHHPNEPLAVAVRLDTVPRVDPALRQIGLTPLPSPSPTSQPE